MLVSGKEVDYDSLHTWRIVEGVGEAWETWFLEKNIRFPSIKPNFTSRLSAFEAEFCAA